jgi:LmbE family N-acetylglucosaminyl deacetylase
MTANVTGPAAFEAPGHLVVLSPHSDDAAYSLAGLIRHCHDLGTPITIVTVFSRSAYAPRLLFRGRDRVTRIRRLEDERFAATVAPGCQMRWLDEPDARLRQDYRGAEAHTSRPLTAGDRALIGKLALAFHTLIDVNATVCLPLGVGGHVDHLIVRDAGLGLARTGGDSLYFYEDLPYAAGYTPSEMKAWVQRATFAGATPLVPHFVAFPGLLACKERALGCYPSQVTSKVLNNVLRHARQLGGTNEPAERVWRLPRGGN